MLLRKKKETGSDMKIFSFFAGVGMLDLGFQDAGYGIVFVNEFKKEFMDSYCYARRKRNYNNQYIWLSCKMILILFGRYRTYLSTI